MTALCSHTDFTRFANIICEKDGDARAELSKIRNPIVNTLLKHGQHMYMDDKTIVLRFEDLDADFRRLCTDVLKIEPIDLPQVNASKHVRDPSQVPCTEETRRMVYDKFKKDYELFGYDMCEDSQHRFVRQNVHGDEIVPALAMHERIQLYQK